MIMAAGFGSRLGALSDQRPKPMLPVCGAPLIRWAALWLRAQGITGVTIKKRGVRLDDEELRRQLRIGRGAGTGASTIVLLTRHAGRQVALALRAD